MSITLKHAYPGAPNTERGRPSVISVDPKTKSKLIYCSGTNVIMRDVNDPLKVDVYTGHANKTTCAKFSPSGYYVCSGDESGTVRIWATDNVDKTLKLEIKPLSKSIRDIAFTDDSQRVVVVGEGKGVYGYAFLLDSGSSVGEISGHSKEVMTVDMRPTRPYRIASGGEDNCVNFYQGPPFKFQSSNKDHKRFINCIRFSPNGEQFISVSSDKSGIIFDGKTGEKKGELDLSKDAHTGSIFSVSWNPESNKVLTAGGDKTSKIWNMDTKQVEQTFTFGDHTNHMQVGSLWVNNDTLLSVGLSGDIHYLDVNNTNKPKRVLHGHNKKIYSLAYDKQSNTLYSAGAEGALLAWELGVGPKARVTGKGLDTAITQIVLCGNNQLLALSNNETGRFVNLTDFAYSAEEIKLEGTPNDVTVSAQDKNLVLIATHKSIQILHGKETKSVLPIKYSATSISISPADDEVIVGGDDKKIYIYSLSNFKLTEVAQLSGSHRGKITRVRYSPDGQWIASADSNREIIVWDRKERKEKYTGLVYHTTSVTDMAWSEDSKYLVSGSVDKAVIVWDVQNEKRAIYPTAHLSGVDAVAFIDANTVASAGGDYFVRTFTFNF